MQIACFLINNRLEQLVDLQRLCDCHQPGSPFFLNGVAELWGRHPRTPNRQQIFSRFSAILDRSSEGRATLSRPLCQEDCTKVDMNRSFLRS
jgi:hypothetical protein